MFRKFRYEIVFRADIFRKLTLGVPYSEKAKFAAFFKKRLRFDYVTLLEYGNRFAGLYAMHHGEMETMC